MVGHAEVTGPGEEPAGHALGLAGVLPARRGELPDGLQHPVPGTRRGVGDLEQRLIGELLQDRQDVGAEQVPGGVGGEPAGEHRQVAHGRLPGRVEEIPAPVDDGVQRAVPLRRVPCAAPQHGEPVVEAAGDLGHRHDPDPRGGQFRGERQPVQAAAQLPHGLRGQVGIGPRRPRPLPEQLGRRGQVQLGQQVHRFRRQAERGPAGGEHAQVLAQRHQGVHQVGGAAHDVLAVVQHQQRGAGTQGSHDPGEHARRAAAAADRVAAFLADAEGGRDLGRDVAVGGDARELDDVHDALLRLAADRVRETGLAQAAGAHDRRDPGRAQQARHGGDVVVPAEQRVGLVPDAAADHGRVGLQQLLVHALQRGARVAAELVAQPLPVVGVPGEGRRGPRGRRLAPQQFGQDLLVPRVLAGSARPAGQPPRPADPRRDSASARDRSSDR